MEMNQNFDSKEQENISEKTQFAETFFDPSNSYPFISLSAIFLAVIAILVYNYPSSSEIIKSVAACMVILTAGYSILTYKFNYHKTVKESKTSKDILTYNSASEWVKANIFDAEMKCYEYEKRDDTLLGNRNPETFTTFIDDLNNISYKKAVHTVLNFLESIALAVEQDLVNHDFIKKFFLNVFKNHISDYYFYICHKRIINEDLTLWLNFTNLAKKWGIDTETYLTKKEN